MNVDLPEPDGPIRKTNSPLSILTLTSSNAGRADALYFLLTWSRVIITARQCSRQFRRHATINSVGGAGVGTGPGPGCGDGVGVGLGVQKGGTHGSVGSRNGGGVVVVVTGGGGGGGRRRGRRCGRVGRAAVLPGCAAPRCSSGRARIPAAPPASPAGRRGTGAAACRCRTSTTPPGTHDQHQGGGADPAAEHMARPAPFRSSSLRFSRTFSVNFTADAPHPAVPRLPRPQARRDRQRRQPSRRTS